MGYMYMYTERQGDSEAGTTASAAVTLQPRWHECPQKTHVQASRIF